MKYDDENIPFDRCVKVQRWNSSRFDTVLLWDALDCELWTMGAPIGDINNTKSITETHKKSHMKQQFINAKNLLGPMTLKSCVKYYRDKSEHKDIFPYDIINTKNWNEGFMKTEPFEYEDFKSQLKGGYSITKYKYDQYLVNFKIFTNSKKQVYYSDFDRNTDNSNQNPNAKPFALTAEQWKNKCYHYKQQDYKADRKTNKNVAADDYDYYKNLFERSVQSICSAKFTYDKLPSSDRQVNELPHMKDNCFPACVSCNIAPVNRDSIIASLHIKMRQIIEIENKEEMIVEYMYSQAQKHQLSITKKDRKLTTILDTNGFIITDYEAIAVFKKNAAQEPFKFYKLIINSSYGYDTLNTEKFGKIKMLDKAGTFIAQHHPNHMGTKLISANTFAVQTKPKTATCFTSIQSGVFTLDNAKYWYLNYIYNFMYKYLDRKRFQFVLADTDSIYIAVAGDPAKDCHQQFESIVTDKL
ncbi:MAG: hypothetical protein EZS28_018055, partial [Streblomastix strix]